MMKERFQSGFSVWVVVGLIAALVIAGCGDSGSSTTTSSSPKVSIVIYSDFQCHYCADLSLNVEEELLHQYVDMGKATMEVKPVNMVGDASSLAAEAALCAGDQGGFWAYSHALFTAWQEVGVGAYSEDSLISTASELGLNQDAFASCLTTHAKQAQVAANTKELSDAGETDIPVMFINDMKIRGIKPLRTYMDIIEAILGSKPVPTTPSASTTVPPSTTTPSASTTAPPSATTLTPTVTPGSKVAIVIYTDLQCHNCVDLFFDVEEELRRLYVDTGKASMEVKPLNGFGDISLAAGEAVLCAGDQGSLWDYSHALLTQWRAVGESAYSEEKLIELANTVGLDSEVFGACLTTGAKAGEVDANRLELLSLDEDEIPIIFINDKKIKGVEPLQTYVDIIEGILDSN